MRIFIINFIIYLISVTSLHSQSSMIIRLGSVSGQDATVISFQPNTNYKYDGDLCSVAWTAGGEYICRSFFRFYLTGISPGTNIDSARLSLFGNPSPLHSPGHSNYSGSDVSYLKKITSYWNDSTVTWNNQPSSTALNEVTLPQSTSSMQDYLNIDVTTLVRDMINNPAANFGLVLQLANESPYRSMNFGSSDCTDSTKRPKLVIYFPPLGITPISSEVPKEFKLFQNYPNPFNPQTKIKFEIPLGKSAAQTSMSVYDALGKEIALLVNEQLKPGTYEVNWNAANVPSGVYFYKLQSGDFIETKKMSLVK